MNAYYCYSPFCLIFATSVCIDRQDPLEFLVLSVILNQIQTFAMKLEGLALALSNFVKYGFLNHQLNCQNNDECCVNCIIHSQSCLFSWLCSYRF